MRTGRPGAHLDQENVPRGGAGQCCRAPGGTHTASQGHGKKKASRTRKPSSKISGPARSANRNVSGNVPGKAAGTEAGRRKTCATTELGRHKRNRGLANHLSASEILIQRCMDADEAVWRVAPPAPAAGEANEEQVGHLTAPGQLLQHLAEADEERNEITVWRIEPPTPAGGGTPPGRLTRKEAAQQRVEEEDDGWADSTLVEAATDIRAWNASVALPADLIRLPTEEGLLMVAGEQARARAARRDRDQALGAEGQTLRLKEDSKRAQAGERRGIEIKKNVVKLFWYEMSSYVSIIIVNCIPNLHID